MTQFLLWLYAFIMVSGFWGLALQHVIPKLMQEYLPEEVIFEEIPYIRGQLLAQGEAIREEIANLPNESIPTADEHGGGATTLAAVSPGAVKAAIEFIDGEALPYLKTRSSRHSTLGKRQTSDSQFRLLKLQLPPNVQPLVEQLQAICDEKRRLDLQTRLHYWLHGWLIVHAPASLLLVVLTVVHAIVAAYLYA